MASGVPSGSAEQDIEIVKLHARGVSVRSIASQLGMSKSSVHAHMCKLGLRPQSPPASSRTPLQITPAPVGSGPPSPFSSSRSARAARSAGMTAPVSRSPAPLTQPAGAPLSPELQKIADITGATGWKPMETLELLKTFGQLSTVGQKTPPTYRRPAVMNARQNEIIDASQDAGVKIILVEGDRRTGKSTAVWVAINELMFAGYRRWGLWGAKQDAAVKILRDVSSDMLTFADIDPLYANKIAMRLERVDGCVLNAHATTVSDAKGFDYDGIWLEEFDQILKDNPLVFSAIIPILRSRPNLKILMTANRDTGAYKLMREYFAQNPDERIQQAVRFFTLTKTEAPHVQQADNDWLIEPLMELSVGRDKTQEQLHNIESYSGEVFNATKLMKALNSYDEWMLHAGFIDASTARTKKRPVMTVIGIDPGFGDATGIMVLSLVNQHAFEEESHLLHGRDERGLGVSEEQVKQLVLTLAKKYGAHIVIESNSGGLWWKDFWESDNHLPVHRANFASPGKRGDRESHIRLMNQFLEEERLHFKNPQLRDQAVIYSMDEKSRGKNRDHGDLVDATMHALWHLVTRVHRVQRTSWAA